MKPNTDENGIAKELRMNLCFWFYIFCMQNLKNLFNLSQWHWRQRFRNLTFSAYTKFSEKTTFFKSFSSWKCAYPLNGWSLKEYYSNVIMTKINRYSIIHTIIQEFHELLVNKCSKTLTISMGASFPNTMS